MKILYHHRTMGRGAEGTHIAHIVNAFNRLGHSVILLSPAGVNPLAEIGKKPLDKTEEKTRGMESLWNMVSRKAPQLIFEILEIIYNFSAIIKLRRLVEGGEVDFIYERNAFFLFAGAFVAKRYSVPLIIEANEAVGIKRARKLIMRSLAMKIEKYTFRRAHSIFSVSSFIAMKIRDNHSRKDGVFVLPNAVEPLDFVGQTNREIIRDKYGISNKIVLGFAGWFDWWDRLDRLVLLQKELLDKGYNNVATLIIGDGPLAEDLQKQIADLKIDDHVILTGPVDKREVLGYIDSLDIGILPHSNKFGSPMVLFEMMALGKCVVAPALAPICDVIDDQYNGILFTSNDEKQLRLKVEAVVADQHMRERVGMVAKQIVFEKHTWEKNAEKILSVYSSRNPV